MIDPITDPRGAVAEFMRAAGQECPDQPVRLSPASQELRRSLILEEIREFQAAADLYEKYGTNDALVAVADALADIAYVTIGAVVSWGLVPRAPLRLNEKREPQRMDRLAAEGYIVGSFGRYLEYVGLPVTQFTGNTLPSLLRAVEYAADHYKIPLAEVFAEVHRSNMTKVIAGKCLLREDGKIMKPPGYSPPNVAAVLRQHGRIA